MLDRFNAARDYIARWDAWNKDKRGPAPRRDLRLEALAEILRGERVVHIHSYRQDEILMFARLAKEFGFPVATFTAHPRGLQGGRRAGRHRGGRVHLQRLVGVQDGGLRRHPVQRVDHDARAAC